MRTSRHCIANNTALTIRRIENSLIDYFRSTYRLLNRVKRWFNIIVCIAFFHNQVTLSSNRSSSFSLALSSAMGSTAADDEWLLEMMDADELTSLDVSSLTVDRTGSDLRNMDGCFLFLLGLLLLESTAVPAGRLVLLCRVASAQWNFVLGSGIGGLTEGLSSGLDGGDVRDLLGEGLGFFLTDGASVGDWLSPGATRVDIFCSARWLLPGGDDQVGNY